MDESKSPTAGHRWAPITDLTPTDRSVQNVELPALADVWHETRKQLADRRAVEMFNERLRREWAIETGIIERIYSLDRGVTQVLIEQGIDASLIPNDATDRPPEPWLTCRPLYQVTEKIFRGSAEHSTRGFTGRQQNRSTDCRNL